MIDLDELMRLHDAATSGQLRHRPDKILYVEQTREIVTQDDTLVCSLTTMDDAAYICAACNAVPELVHRIRELEAQRDRLQDAAEFEARVAAKQATAICGQCDKFNSSEKGCPLAIFTRPGLDACRLKHARLAVEQEMLAEGKGTGRSVKS